MRDSSLTLDKIYEAASVLKKVVRKTDVIPALNLSTDCNLFLKAENLQNTGSFKLRGAYFKMATLPESDKKKGVIACSAGNHAQGVALAAKENKIEASIFLPSTAPISKIEATKAYGVEVKLIDGIYDDAYSAALNYRDKTGGVFIHPFNDIDVIAGQGTIGLEILEQIPNLDAVVVPIGGGGLISGIAYVIKNLNPKCKVYGVQAFGASSMCESLHSKNIICSKSVCTFADGIAVKNPGEITYQYCLEYVDDIVTVTDDEIATAILALIEKQKLIAEGAGAVSVAAVMFNKIDLKGKNVCAIVSGGNIDVNILSRVINRGLLKTGRITNLTIELLDKPGQLKEVSTVIANLGANVIRVQYTPGGENTDINGCYLRISMETRDHIHLEDIKNALKEKGYTLGDNR